MKFFKRNKKGALELSVTAIVVLIIAITILGLVIVFVKKSFGGATDIVGGELSRIKSELKQNIKNSGELLIVQPDLVEARRGKPEQFLVAIQNTAQSKAKGVCFIMKFECKYASSPVEENTCKGIAAAGATTPPPLLVGGIDAERNLKPLPQDLWFKGLPGGGKVEIKNLESEAYDVSLLVKSGKPDTYRIELTVYKETQDADCTAPSGFAFYTSKTFDVKLQQ